MREDPEIQFIDTPSVADPRRFGSPTSNATRVGSMVYVSGMLGWDTDRRLVGSDIDSQTSQAIRNIASVLDVAGGGLANVLKVTFYLTDIRHKEAVWRVRERLFGQHRPASTLVEVAHLVDPGALIEIEAVAHVPTNSEG